LHSFSSSSLCKYVDCRLLCNASSLIAHMRFSVPLSFLLLLYLYTLALTPR
jgi:hypothetical protein